MISERMFRLKKDGTLYKNSFCRTPELIENYSKAIADDTQTWDCHHRLETHNSDGERRLVDISREELIALDMYFDRPPEELIFLTKADHARLHMKGNSVTMKGKHHSEEAKRKISEANRGKHRSEESRRRYSEARKGKHNSEESNRKRSETMKDHLVSEETRKKMSEAAKKRKYQKTSLIQIVLTAS